MPKIHKHKIDRIHFYNRWKYPKYSRPCDWTIIGISTWWSSPESYSYRIGFFGLELRIWIHRQFLNQHSQ